MAEPPAPPAAADAARPGLVRAIGRWSLTAAVVNGVIGSGIFNLPSELARHTGALSPLAALLAGLGVLTIVLCFAEVASRFREGGGPYLYGREAFGPFVGFQAGWLNFWIRSTAVAAGLNGFALYLSQILPWAGTRLGRLAAMTLLMALVTAINVRGVREATWTVNLFTLAKLVPLLALIALGIGRLRPEVLDSQVVAVPDWTQAILLLIFAYGGFESPLVPAGEARNPQRDTAFALLTALALIAAVYMLIQLVVVGVVPNAAAAKAPVAAAFGVLLGGAGTVVASLAAMLSMYGYVTGAVLQTPRSLLAMAERGELPAALARVHPGFRTPDVAIYAFSGVTLALAVYGSFGWNAVLSAIARLLTYGMTCVALLALRRQRPQEPPGFRLPGALVVAPLATAFCLWLLSTRPFHQAVLLPAVMALGALLMWASRWRQGRRSA
jgi:basic amino acid/polyamine antiporter, APA family